MRALQQKRERVGGAPWLDGSEAWLRRCVDPGALSSETLVGVLSGQAGIVALGSTAPTRVSRPKSGAGVRDLLRAETHGNRSPSSSPCWGDWSCQQTVTVRLRVRGMRLGLYSFRWQQRPAHQRGQDSKVATEAERRGPLEESGGVGRAPTSRKAALAPARSADRASACTCSAV